MDTHEQITGFQRRAGVMKTRHRRRAARSVAAVIQFEGAEVRRAHSQIASQRGGSTVYLNQRHGVANHRDGELRQSR